MNEMASLGVNGFIWFSSVHGGQIDRDTEKKTSDSTTNFAAFDGWVLLGQSCGSTGWDGVVARPEILPAFDLLGLVIHVPDGLG